MSQPTHQLDPGKFIVSLGLVPKPISGYAPGTFIELSRDVDAFSKHVGSDGEVTRVASKNKAGSLKIVLQQGSLSNADLSALAVADENSLTGITNVLVMDMSGQVPQTTGAAVQGWVKKMPAASFSGNSEENREWIIDLASMDFFIGGN